MIVLDSLQVINIPDGEWLTRLRRGHFVWLSKQEQFAKIEWAYEPPPPGMFAGEVGLEILWRTEDAWGRQGSQIWFVKPDGTGFDGLPLLEPVKDNCPDEPLPISEPWQRQVERRLAILTHQVDQLASVMDQVVIMLQVMREFDG